MPSSGPMRYVKRNSNFEILDNILIVNMEEDTNALFVQDVSKNSAFPLAIISIDNEYDSVVSCAIELANKLQNRATCVICICQDSIKETDKEGDKFEAPIEIQLKELKEKCNTIIIAQKIRGVKTDIINMLLSFFDDAPDKAKLLAEKFNNGGFAYYNSYYSSDVYNCEAHMDYLLFDSLFICPIYLSEEVFCSIEGGGAFELDKVDSMGDEGIMASYLSDYLQTDKIHFKMWKNSDLLPYAINTQLLFCGFNEEDFAFDDNGISHYVEATDSKLNNRIKRMLTLPFQNKEKIQTHKKNSQKHLYVKK